MAESNNIQAELHSYLAEKKINALFVSIVEAILVERPDNPIGMMVDYLLEHYPEETKGCAANQRKNCDTTDKPPSLVLTNKCTPDDEGEAGSDCSSVHSEESLAPSTHDEPSICEKPPQRKKRRESVCAEKITDDVVKESELKVIAKTETEAARIRSILHNTVFFSHLDEHQMETVQNVMFSVDKSDGDVIIKQGDPGDNFYVVDGGSVEVFIDSSETGERNLVKTCEAGDAFGELAIMYNAPRAASCIAKGDVRLWALDRVSFNVILMKTTMAKRKSMTDALLKIPVFGQLTEYELLSFADTLQEETFEDKTIICTQGDRGDKFYLVHEGTAVCSIAQEDGASAEVARLSSGSYFGEIALLTTKPRQATVTADGPLQCFTLNRRTFNRVMGPLQDILMRNMNEYNKIRASTI